MKNGKFDEDAPEYVVFKRQNITKWGVCSQFMQQIEKFLAQYPVYHVYIDVMRLLQLADLDLEKYSRDDILSCVTNKVQVSEAINNPKNKFKGPNGPVLAVLKIQTAWRRHKAFSAFAQLKFLMIQATIIQRKFRLFQLKKSTKIKVRQLNDQSRAVWRDMQNEFRKCWPDIKRGRRIEVHINSYTVAEMKRMSVEKLKQKENSQILRIFAVKDPNVDVIYISPFTLTSEVYKYYMKILELVEVEDPSSRFHLVVPENYVRFHSHLSLAQAMLYSPKALKQISNLIEGRQAYIVPGKVGEDDIKLSIQLGIPTMCGEPDLTTGNIIYATKSGAKRIFQLCDIPIPMSAYDIQDREEFEMALARLIVNNLDVNVWVFKIDDEFQARGHAILEVEQLKTVVELRKRKV